MIHVNNLIKGIFLFKKENESIDIKRGIAHIAKLRKR